MLLAVVVATACSNDDEAGVLSTKSMLNQELVASNYSFIWNGVTSPSKKDIKAKFESVSGDSTKMKMTISDLIPSSDGEIQLVVDLLPKSDEIQYQGQVTNSDYSLTVSGTYFPSTSTKGYYFGLTCAYNVVRDQLCEQPFEFDFKNGCTSVQSGDDRFTTIDDVEYSYKVLAEKTLSGMTGLYAKANIGSKLTFSKDGVLAIDLLSESKGGEIVEANLMNIKYWLPNANELLLEFTEAQAKTFIEKFLKADTYDIESLFTKYNEEDRYILRAAYLCDGKLSIKLAAPYNADALTMFMNGKLADTKDALLQKQVGAFQTVLQETPDIWGLYFVSK